jgi:predicted nucleic acid-binding protein
MEVGATPAARRVWKQDPDWWVPPLWRSEFLNVLVQSIRSHSVGERQARALWRLATELFASYEIQPSEEVALELALDRKISAYDAQFVALAAELGVVLVSADRELVRKCPDIAVLIEDFESS